MVRGLLTLRKLRTSSPDRTLSGFLRLWSDGVVDGCTAELTYSKPAPCAALTMASQNAGSLWANTIDSHESHLSMRNISVIDWSSSCMYSSFDFPRLPP